MLFYLRDEILWNHGERFFLFACPSLVSGPLELVSSSGGELDCAFKLFEELKADGKLDLDEIAAWRFVSPVGGLAKFGQARLK